MKFDFHRFLLLGLSIFPAILIKLAKNENKNGQHDANTCGLRNLTSSMFHVINRLREDFIVLTNIVDDISFALYKLYLFRCLDLLENLMFVPDLNSPVLEGQDKELNLTLENSVAFLAKR